jgi:hypothetical protein
MRNNMYPLDAITLYRELVGAGSYTLVSGTTPKTIIGVSIQQSATNSTSDVRCGATDIFVRNYGKDFPFNIVNKKCNDVIVVEKTGNDSASFALTYVNYQEQPVSTSSAITMLPSSTFMEAMHGMTYIMFISFAILIFFLAVQFGLSFYGRK